MAGLYFHIPFCSYKCLYCDFYSGNQLYLIDSYVDSLIIELKLRQDYLKNESIQSIYFGGGTPSLLSHKHLSKILNAVYHYLIVDPESEVTIECNPENISEHYVDELYDLGINRISLGIQFLDNEILEKYNRKHSKELIFKSLDIIERSDIKNLSIDLIFSVPGISDEFLLSTLEQLIRYDIKHVSAYSLTIAKNSQLFWKIKKGEFSESDEPTFLSQYRLINDFLKARDFKQYEISNYCKDGFYSRHNLGYWNQIPYLGLGVSAHSYNGVSRQWNGTNIKKYIRDLSKEDAQVDFEIEQLTEIQLYNEFVILRLRTFQGISLEYIRKNFNNEIYVHFVKNVNILKGMNHFNFEGDHMVSRDSDLLIADYLSQFLMI
jgi:oxygen-independent coproporphyrinogen III oxidase